MSRRVCDNAEHVAYRKCPKRCINKIKIVSCYWLRQYWLWQGLMIYVDVIVVTLPIFWCIKNKNPLTNLLYYHRQYYNRLYILVDMKSNEGIHVSSCNTVQQIYTFSRTCVSHSLWLCRNPIRQPMQPVPVVKQGKQISNCVTHQIYHVSGKNDT